MLSLPSFFFFFFFNDTATTEIYTLSLHDALPIFGPLRNRIRRRSRSAARMATQWRSLPSSSRAAPVCRRMPSQDATRSEEHTSELQSPDHLVCRLLLEKKKIKNQYTRIMIMHLEE